MISNKYIEIALVILLGVIIFYVIRFITTKLSSRLSMLRPSNIFFAWLIEIASDIRNLGKGLAYYFLFALPVTIELRFIMTIALRLLQCYFVILLGVFLVAFLNVWEQWQIQKIDPELPQKDKQFLKTLYPLLSNTGKYAVYGVGVVSLFSVWGIDVSAFLGATALFTLVIGIGGQNLIGDVLAGIFIVFERSFYADSLVEIIYSDKQIIRGRVIKITWRVTHIQEDSGTFTIVANRTIDKVRIIER